MATETETSAFQTCVDSCQGFQVQPSYKHNIVQRERRKDGNPEQKQAPPPYQKPLSQGLIGREAGRSLNQSLEQQGRQRAPAGGKVIFGEV